MTASASPASFSPGGGTGTLSVSTNRECEWSASPTGGWIQLSGSANGQGDARIPFSVAPNGEPAERRGAIAVGDQQVAIAQQAGACTFRVSPVSESMTPSGGRRSVSVTTSSAQCPWTARADVSWLVIIEGAQGNGSGRVVYEARATTGPSRTGTLVVAGHTVTVTQGHGCSTAIAPEEQIVGASGGSGTIAVNTGAGCKWSAQSDVPWLSIQSGQNGTGPGMVSFAAGAWDGPTRAGTIHVNQHVFTVTQTAGCSYTIQPESQSVSSAGGNGDVAVRTAPGCTWSAAANAPWLAITNGATGSGDGQAQFTALASSGPARDGTLTIAGRLFTVQQASGCTFSLSEPGASVPAGGGGGSVRVATDSGCAWNVTSGASWIRITSGSGGSGPGEVRFSATANSGPPRTGTITIGGQIFTVTQAGGCSLSLSPASQSFASGGGSSSITVTVADGCSWNATASESWVRITSGASGSGNGSIQYTVEANAGSARDATITAEGRTVNIHQSAGCSYSLGATSGSVAASGGTGSVSVTTGESCTWAATTASGWVHITAGASGTGPGTVEYSADANDGDARNATITIAGIAYTLSQAGTCSFSIDPSSLLIDAAGGSGSFALTTGSSCTWTAVSNDAWLRVTSGASGTGSDTVAFTAEANLGPARSGTITAGGRTFTANQNSGCSIGISPSGQSFGSDAGGGTINVTASGGCMWSATVTSGGEWISIVSGSGSGDGTVQFSVAANPGAARSGTIAIGGQTFTVTQSGV